MKKLITILVVGIVFALGPIWGVIGTVIGMTLAFGHLAESEPQTGALASDIGFALFTTVAGYIMCPIGIVLIVIAAIKMSTHQKQELTVRLLEERKNDWQKNKT